MIKGTIHQEDITFINIYAPNIGAPKYIKKLLTDIKGEVKSNTTIVGDFYIPFKSMDRSSRQKVNKVRAALNETSDPMDLIDLYRTYHSNAAEYTFLSSAHELSPE